MSTEDKPITDAAEDKSGEDVAHGVTNEPRGSGDRDDDAISASEAGLDRAGGGH